MIEFNLSRYQIFIISLIRISTEIPTYTADCTPVQCRGDQDHSQRDCHFGQQWQHAKKVKQAEMGEKGSEAIEIIFEEFSEFHNFLSCVCSSKGFPMSSVYQEYEP